MFANDYDRMAFEEFLWVMSSGVFAGVAMTVFTVGTLCQMGVM